MRYTDTFILRLRAGVKPLIEKLAQRWDVSPSEIGRRAIRDYLDKHMEEENDNISKDTDAL